MSCLSGGSGRWSGNGDVGTFIGDSSSVLGGWQQRQRRRCPVDSISGTIGKCGGSNSWSQRWKLKGGDRLGIVIGVKMGESGKLVQVSLCEELIINFEIFTIAKSVLLCDIIRRREGDVKDTLHDRIREVSRELVGVFV